ncbi:MAG: SDR family oxidoreductase [Candidatus Eremiobacteraeota bacterium]|nr:SDR family oxidoreductase [Candidatus Eremiobacteraeota bacterium]
MTGASRGIGRAVALALGRRGAKICVHYRQQSAQAEAVVSELGGGFACQADLAVPAQVEALIETAHQRFGRLDFLVNNAAVMSRKPVAELEPDDYARVFDVNVRGLMLACQAAARRMGQGGRIINFSSSVTRLLLSNYALYAASKGAVEQFSRVLAKELGPRGITVNVVSPGPTDTDMFRQGKSQADIEGLAAAAALGRIGQPQDVAEVVAFLVGPGGAFVSGQIVGVNGGFAP